MKIKCSPQLKLAALVHLTYFFPSGNRSSSWRRRRVLFLRSPQNQKNVRSLLSLVCGPTKSPRNPVLQRSPKRRRNLRSKVIPISCLWFTNTFFTVNHVQFSPHMLTEVCAGILLFSKCFNQSSACSVNGASFLKSDTCQLEAVTGSFLLLSFRVPS